jgi:hypothetical protein
MKRLELFNKSEIEKMGFTFEPDVNKCKCGFIKTMFATFYVKDGIVSYEHSIKNFFDVGYDKTWIANHLYFKYINSIHVDLFEQEDHDKLIDCQNNYHGHIRIKICGHTRL